MARDRYFPLAIPQRFLRHGCYYAGTCRGANIAVWNKETQLFHHWNSSCGQSYVETIEYWDPEGSFDGFIPLFDLGFSLPDPITLPPLEPK